MAAMEGAIPSNQSQLQPQQQPQQQQQQQQQQPPPPPAAAERLNAAVQQQLRLESVKGRATTLFKAISRILEDFDAYARTNATPKWQDILGQYAMVNLELFKIVEEIRTVSKAFVVHPKNVNAENSTILPVMLSSKLLPEMETDDNSKREQLLQGMQNLPVASQIEKLKARIDMIAAACESAEKVLSDTRKAYGFGARQGPTIAPTLDKAQAAKIQEQENILRAAVNYGEGLRTSGDQRQMPPALPMHLSDVLHVGDGMQNLADASDNFLSNSGSFFSGIYQKSSSASSNNMSGTGALLQGTGTQLLGRSAASPGASSFDNSSASPMPYANSPRSGTNMNTPSPQQQSQQQQPQQQQQQQQQRQKMMQLPQHQQILLAQQQFRQPTMSALGQGQPQMQYTQTLGHQQFQGRQLPSGPLQHSIGQGQLNQGNMISRHLNQFSGSANSALFNAAQTAPNNQMIPNISTMQSQSLLPRMQFGLSGTNPQRSHASQMLNDQIYNMGAANATNMIPVQQQQQQQQQQQPPGSQGAFGNMAPNAQGLQSGMVTLPNASQNHPNFSQQRQQNQQ